LDSYHLLVFRARPGGAEAERVSLPVLELSGGVQPQPDLFEIGGHLGQVFQALIDRSRVLLDLKTIKMILGCKHRPKYRKWKKKSAEWEVAVEKPA
jgi:hypothetical protein